MEGNTSSIATILSAVGDVFTEAMSWASAAGEMIVETPILLLYAVVPVVGLGIGIFKRLININ